MNEEVQKTETQNESNEETTNTITEKAVTEEKVVEKDEDDSSVYFVYLNRFITSLLSSLITIGLVLASWFGVEALFGGSAFSDLEVTTVTVFTLLCGLSLFIGQSIQNYFVKIIEKESYKFVLGKTVKNFVWQILMLALFLPAMIYSLSLGGEYLFWSSSIFVLFSGLIASSIREAEHANRLQATLLGVFVGSIFWLLFSFNLYQGGSDIWRFAYLALLPLSSVVAEIVVLMADLIGNYFKD